MALSAQFPPGFAADLPGCSGRGRRSLACPQRLTEQPPRTFSRLALVCTRVLAPVRLVGGTIGGSRVLGVCGAFRAGPGLLESEGLGFTCPCVSPTELGREFLAPCRRRGVFPSAPAWFQGGYCPRWRRFGLILTCPWEWRLPAGAVARRGWSWGCVPRISSSRSLGGFDSAVAERASSGRRPRV